MLYIYNKLLMNNILDCFNDNIFNFVGVIFLNKYLQQIYYLRNTKTNNRISYYNITPFSSHSEKNENEIIKKTDEDDNCKMFNNENRYLMVSTNALSISCLYALFKKNYRLSSLFGLQYFVANKYWKNPTYNMRKIDLLVQRICITYNFIYYNSNVENFNNNIASNILLLFGLFFYKKGWISYENREIDWYKYHVLFHISGSMSQMITIN